MQICQYCANKDNMPGCLQAKYFKVCTKPNFAEVVRPVRFTKYKTPLNTNIGALAGIKLGKKLKRSITPE